MILKFKFLKKVFKTSSIFICEAGFDLDLELEYLNAKHFLLNRNILGV